MEEIKTQVKAYQNYVKVMKSSIAKKIDEEAKKACKEGATVRSLNIFTAKLAKEIAERNFALKPQNSISSFKKIAKKDL